MKLLLDFGNTIKEDSRNLQAATIFKIEEAILLNWYMNCLQISEIYILEFFFCLSIYIDSVKIIDFREYKHGYNTMNVKNYYIFCVKKNF